MAIYVRNEETKELESLEIPAIKGKDGITPNVQIGEVTTLEPNEKATVIRRGTNINPIFDFGIPRGQDGGGSVLIDDTTLSVDKTWSSSKVEDFVLNNDNVMWLDVSGESLKVDSSKEGYLREIEIFGNTVQGFADCVTHQQIVDSINATGFQTATLNNDGTFTVSGADTAPSSTNWAEINKENFISLKPNTKYSICCWRDNGAYPGVQYTLYEEEGIKSYTSNTYKVFTTGQSGKILFYPGSAQGGKLKIRVVEGEYNLKDYPYDYNLSDIQHLGELYVNDEGEPILDSQGREQYKVEIETINSNLIPNNLKWTFGDLSWVNGVGGTQEWQTRFYCIDFINVEPNTEYTTNFLMKEFSTSGKSCLVAFYRNDGSYISGKEPNSSANAPYTFTTPNECTKIRLRGDLPHDRDISKSLMLFRGKCDDMPRKYIPHQSYKTSILLPCQLMKIGDVADRLYWDNEKGRYVIEKKIYNKYFNKGDIKLTGGAIGSTGTDYYGWGNIYVEGDYYKVNHFITDISEENMIVYIFQRGGRSELNFTVKGVTSLEEANSKLSDLLPFNVIYLATPSKLIETNITEQIKLPTYLNTTYITVSGGLQGSVKAKVPVDKSSVVNNLVQGNKELKATNDEQDEIVNISLMAMGEIFTILEPILDTTVLSSEGNLNKIASMYKNMILKGTQNNR